MVIEWICHLTAPLAASNHFRNLVSRSLSMICVRYKVAAALLVGLIHGRGQNSSDKTGSSFLTLRCQLFSAAGENSDIAADSHKCET
jgi:hypothetical protein